MASLQHTSAGWQLQFKLRDRRRTMRLGRISDGSARRWQALVEQAADEIDNLGGLSPQSRDRIDAMPAKGRAKMERAGFVQRRDLLTVALLCARFDAQSERKESTDTFYGHTARNLCEFLGDATAARDVTAERAAEFRQWLLKDQKLSTPTVNRRIRAARTIFKLAGLAPFAKVKAGASTNPARKQHVPAEVVEGLIGMADYDLAMSLALARFGGLRFPSEVASVMWNDIDEQAGTMRVRSPKTAHHVGGGERIVPLFPDLRQHLAHARRYPNGSTLLVPSLGWQSAASFTNRLVRLLRRTGVERWPRLWQNLRASCESDLCGWLSPVYVAAWMGHSLHVASQHYHTVPEHALQMATHPPGSGVFQGVPPVVKDDASSTTDSGLARNLMSRKGLGQTKRGNRKHPTAARRDARNRKRQAGLARAYRRAVRRRGKAKTKARRKP